MLLFFLKVTHNTVCAVIFYPSFCICTREVHYPIYLFPLFLVLLVTFHLPYFYTLSLSSTTVPYFICFPLSLHLSHFFGSFSPFLASFPLLVISHFVSLSIQFHAAIVSLSLPLSLLLHQFILFFPQTFPLPQASNLSNLYESSPPPPLLLPPLLLSSHPVYAFYYSLSFSVSSPLPPKTLLSTRPQLDRRDLSICESRRVCVWSLRELLPSPMVNQE